jgi:hypothetical protein
MVFIFSRTGKNRSWWQGAGHVIELSLLQANLKISDFSCLHSLPSKLQAAEILHMR